MQSFKKLYDDLIPLKKMKLVSIKLSYRDFKAMFYQDITDL